MNEPVAPAVTVTAPTVENDVPAGVPNESLAGAVLFRLQLVVVAVVVAPSDAR